MLKEIVKKVLICDGCKKEHPDDEMNVVMFTTHTGDRGYDICNECLKQWEDILSRPIKTEESRKPINQLTLSDFKSIENRKMRIEGDQHPTQFVNNIGIDREERCKKILQKMYDDGYSQGRMSRLSGTSQSQLSKIIRGTVGYIQEWTLDNCEKMFRQEGYLKE